ncbi:MAG: DUF2284 domain-containing protein [Candidatus Thorarchaeota archaeon]
MTIKNVIVIMMKKDSMATSTFTESIPVVNRDRLGELFKEHELSDFKWIDPGEIVVSQWVRMKCTFGCPDYGGAACPPNNPPVADCRRWISEYKDAVVFRFPKTTDSSAEYKEWLSQITQRLIEVEKAVFLSGRVKVFLLTAANCSLCKECVSCRVECRHKKQARPTPEGMAIDVFATVSKLGFPLEVLKVRSAESNRYAILLIH